jgi:hypothetical protein
MGKETAGTPFTIEWDDGAMFIFSFTDANGSKQFCGFPHQALGLANLQGTQTQINAITQQIVQSQVQVTTDPATWIETVKTGARGGGGGKQMVTYDDTISTQYTATLLAPGTPPSVMPGPNFTLQVLYSITG